VSGFNRLVEPAGDGLSDSQTQALCIGRFEHEPGVLARESEGEARRELVLDHHVPLDVSVWQPKRSAFYRLEKALRLDTDTASEGDRLGEHLDEADDPVVHHQLEAGPSPRLPKPEGSAPYRIEKGCAIQTALFTEEGCERIMRFAFELALKRERKKVTSVTKSNAQQYSSVLWDEVFARVSAEYPDVETEQWLVDAIAARFVLRPETLEVVVASNLFADILSDLGGALAGSLGVAASANLDPRRRRPSMFEPVHGSAPDIAGKGIANPVGALSSAALMLEHLGLEEEAERVDRAIEATTGSWLLTPDLGGTSTTREVGDAALAYLSRGPEPA
jgi:Isocitrate/isopropylmalate dehydrogenase